VSLADYVSRMKEGQEPIYFITADSLAAAQSSPQLEVFRKKGIEVLLLTDRVDEWMLSAPARVRGQALQSVAKGSVDLGKLLDESEKKAAEQAAESFKPVLERLKEALKERAKDVRVTTRLVDSPACIVVEEGDMSAHLARMLKQAGPERSRGPAHAGGEPRACAGQGLERPCAVRGAGPGAVRPGAAGRGRSVGRSGCLCQARQRAAGPLNCIS
jgi:molecular chaperone HtpG